MWCCLLNDWTVRRIVAAKPDSWLDYHLHRLRKGAAKYKAEHGLRPRPAVLLATTAGRAA